MVKRKIHSGFFSIDRYTIFSFFPANPEKNTKAIGVWAILNGLAAWGDFKNLKAKEVEISREELSGMTGLSIKEIRSILQRFIDMSLIEPAETIKGATKIFKMGQLNSKLSLTNIKSAGQLFSVDFADSAPKQTDSTPNDIVIKSEGQEFLKKGQLKHLNTLGEVKDAGQVLKAMGQLTTT